MSLADCVPALVKRGEIDAARGARMTALFEELERYYRRSMGADAAAAEASEATLRQLAEEARLKKRQTLLQAARQRDCLKDLDRFRGDNRYAAVRALLDDDDRAPYRGGNVTTAHQRILFQAQARVAGFIEHHRRDLLGKARDAEGLADVVRELHAPGSTDNARAKLFAQAIGDTFSSCASASTPPGAISAGSRASACRTGTTRSRCAPPGASAGSPTSTRCSTAPG